MTKTKPLGIGRYYWIRPKGDKWVGWVLIAVEKIARETWYRFPSTREGQPCMVKASRMNVKQWDVVEAKPPQEEA